MIEIGPHLPKLS